MPVVSQAQNRFMHAHENDKGSLGSVAREFTANQAPGSIKKLPERVGPGSGGGNPAARHHALSMASATHLMNAGHIPRAQGMHIQAKAKAGIAQAKGMRPFGSLAPEM